MEENELVSDNRTEIRRRGRPKSTLLTRNDIARGFGCTRSTYYEHITVARYLELYPKLKEAKKKTWAMRVVRGIRQLENLFSQKHYREFNKLVTYRSETLKPKHRQLFYKMTIKDLLERGVEIGNLKDTEAVDQLPPEEIS